MRPIDADALIKKIQHDVAMDTNAIQYFGVTPEKEKALKDKIAVEQKCMNYINHAASIDIVRCKCDFGKCHEQGDTLYESSDWDGGIGFDYIRDIKYCPLCGGLLDGEEQTEKERASDD